MPFTTELLIARHGEAICNVHGIVGGDRGCTGLTDHGRRQAHQLAARLAREHAARAFDVVYTTPRRRVRETAAIVTEVLDVAVVIDAELRGADHGDADGQLWRRVKDSFGGPPQHDPAHAYAENSETWSSYLHRATNALRRIIDQHPQQRILILAHGETIEAANTLLLGLPPGTCRHARFTTDHACVTRWQLHTNRLGQSVWMLITHNDTSHLTPELA
ncbi:histidine phosphatase family protein [Nocardia gamkensis]|uniref:histidine phosphatase family protein n=1 Tax=Nocardia gamkensis TaxID=352869 RepID=UPI0037C72348